MEAVWNGTAELVDGLGVLTGGLIDWLAQSLYLSSPNFFTLARSDIRLQGSLYLLT
jgi:hypothetical protein